MQKAREIFYKIEKITCKKEYLWNNLPSKTFKFREIWRLALSYLSQLLIFGNKENLDSENKKNSKNGCKKLIRSYPNK